MRGRARPHEETEWDTPIPGTTAQLAIEKLIGYYHEYSRGARRLMKESELHPVVAELAEVYGSDIVQHTAPIAGGLANRTDRVLGGFDVQATAQVVNYQNSSLDRLGRKYQLRLPTGHRICRAFNTAKGCTRGSGGPNPMCNKGGESFAHACWCYSCVHHPVNSYWHAFRPGRCDV